MQPSLSEMIALNDEIAALVRAGVPLELGLSQLSESAPTGLARLSQRISERMSAGATLQDALKQEGSHAPDIYVAVVEAGIRANRLPEALESVSTLSRSLLELHRKVVLALIYPSIVVVIAYGLFVAFMVYFLGNLNAVYQTLQFKPGFAIRTLTKLGETVEVWGPGIPLGVLMIAYWMTVKQPRSDGASLVPRAIYRFRWIPWIRSTMDQFDNATFARIAGLLVQHKAPLHDAILLAGHATGNSRLRDESDSISERLQTGDSLENTLKVHKALPSFLCWMMTLGSKQGSLDKTLQQASDVYESRAQQHAHWARVTLPILLTVGVAGLAVFIYSQALFLPVLELYRQLMIPAA